MLTATKELFTRPSGGYQISRSVRTRASASGSFSRTPASASNRTTWTWSGWVKRGALTTSATGGVFGIFGGGTLGTSQSNFVCYFNSNTDIYLQETVNNVSNQLIYETTSFYRDPSAWYHIIVAMDTTQATATNRVKIYVNGVQAPGAFSVTPGQNQALSINNNVPQYLGGASVNPQAYGNVLGYFDGYITEVNFVDGQQLTPSSFGEIDTVTGVWKPKKYMGTYGTNGYYLNFSDNSASTAAAIGKDYSGNGNNWTPSGGISVTAGTTYDSMLDVPTMYGDGGNGRGNYCVLNPANVSGGTTTTITEGNLATNVASTTTFGIVAGTLGMTTGKWYWEVLITAVGGTGLVGISDGTPARGATGLGGAAGEIAYVSTGNRYTNATTTAYGATYTTNDLIGVAYNADAGSITFYKNNTSQGAVTGFSGTKFPAVGSAGGTNPQYTVNFGQRPFAYTPPTGFVALNTQNLPTPTISKGNQYFDATTYTGTSASNAVVNASGFQPDLVWLKNRNYGSGTNHVLVDTVRGASLGLASNLTNADFSTSGNFSSINSNGFTVTGTARDYNFLNDTFVGWQWNAGGSTVTNTSGSITSQVRANPTAGFSVVTYTGTGATGATVGHGLGAVPQMIIVKNRTTAAHWPVGHVSLPSWAYNLYLSLTNAQAVVNTSFNSTTPTSTVFTLGPSGNETNSSGNNFVAYCFTGIAGYSKFGSYTGNSSADGPFVHLGFRPRFILIKRTDTINQWMMFDTSRSAYNQSYNYLMANLADAEAATSGSTDTLDFLSNGFKLRGTTAAENASGGTYIYAAFAENPFKNSLAR